MTIVVPIAADPSGPTRAALARRRAVRRSLMVGATMALIGSIAAVPLPVWKAGHEIADHADALRGWIADAQREQAEVAQFRASDGETRSRLAAADVERWLLPRDRMETRNLILKTARACGLAVTGAEMTADIDPLAAEGPSKHEATVLGTALSEPVAAAPASVLGTPLALQADRYVVSGTGPAPSLLLFCGVLHAMPAPLRLRSVRIDAAGDSHRFTITIDKLRDASVAPLPEPEPELESHVPQDA